VRLCQRNNSADSEEGGEGGASGTGSEILLQPVVKTMVRQAVPLQPMGIHSGADLHLQPMQGTPCQSRWMHLKKAVTPWEAHTRAGSWQDLWTHGERIPCWSRFAGRTCDPVGDPHWSSLFLKDCTPWKRPTMEQFVKNCSLWEGLTLEKFVENCLWWEGPPQWSRGRV